MREKELDRKIIILFYILLIGPLSIFLFLYGFFPLISYDKTIATENDIPKFIENVRVKTDTLYQPMVKKMIIMVIDALRWDFITGSIGKVAMPVTSSLIANSSACLLRSKIQPPTVTMPRIKAVTTGTIPNFADVAFNFGSKPVFGDSLLLQAKQHGYKSIFYGDETWLLLFPSIFDRYDGTTSFVVTDFTEVDDNVTRHLHEELYNNNDWSIMILHYLGLDHIGHVHGPFSTLIKTKLKEMDDIISKIYSKIQEWNQNNDSSLFIICGDHGMRDSGGHGGSTSSETNVPFIAIGGQCVQNHNRFTEIEQIDIASTLSIILGVPIPFSNFGTAFLDTLYDLPISKKLFVLYYNAKQVFNHFQKLTDYKSEYAYKKYLEALKLHSAWLNTKDHPNDMTDDIVFSYKVALKEMKTILMNNVVKYDFHIITIAIFFLCHIICILLGKSYSRTATVRNTTLLVVSNIFAWTLINYFGECESMSLLWSWNFNTVAILSFVTIVLIINSHLLAGIKCFSLIEHKTAENGIEKHLLIFGTLVHTVTLGGSSFVEEEHQTWYFYWVSLLVLLLYNSTVKFCLHSQSYRNPEQHSYAQTCTKLLLLLIGHRIFRQLNSTGDKYAHLPDIAEFLIEQENKLHMTILVVIALALLLWLDFIREDERYKRRSLIFNSIICVCIYTRHMHGNSVIKIPFYPQSRGIFEVQIFWILLAINFMKFIYHLTLTIKYNETMFLKIVLSFLIRTLIAIAAMLHQPHNIILVPFQVIFSKIIHEIVKDSFIQETNTLLYMWLGNVFYFYQGNSNSLATVDVAAGYVGIQSYMPLLIGSLITINTYSAPILAYLLLVYHAVLRYPCNVCEIVTKISKTYITWRLLPVTVYTIIISIQHHHLFIWSVFSPKLLYEAGHSMVICFIMCIILILIVIQKTINSNK